MNDPDAPLPPDCSRCPLRLPLPDELSDAAVAHLVEGLYLFAEALENGYYRPLAALLRHARRPRPTPTTTSRHPQQPSTRTSPMTTCRSERQLAPRSMATLQPSRPSAFRCRGIPAHRESRSQCGILRRPDRGIPIYQTAGAYSSRRAATAPRLG